MIRWLGMALFIVAAIIGIFGLADDLAVEVLSKPHIAPAWIRLAFHIEIIFGAFIVFRSIWTAL